MRKTITAKGKFLLLKQIFSNMLEAKLNKGTSQMNEYMNDNEGAFRELNVVTTDYENDGWLKIHKIQNASTELAFVEMPSFKGTGDTVRTAFWNTGYARTKATASNQVWPWPTAQTQILS